MKKIFSLLTLVMMAVSSAWAGDVFTYSLNGGKAVSDPAGFFTYDTSGKFSFNTKFTGAEYDGVSYTNGLKMEGTTKILFTTTVESIVTIVQSTWSANTIKLDGVELKVADAETGTGCRIYTVSDVAAGDHAITRGSGESGLFLVKVEYTAEDLTPSLTASPKTITLSANPLGRTRSDEFSLNGKNLQDGTYSLTVPAVEGLSVEPASFVVTDGMLEQTFTVTYTSEMDVEKATVDVKAVIGDIEAVVAVTYQSRAAVYEQTIVSEEMTWNWETLTETVELSENTVPSINDEFVFRELDDKINFGTFDAQSIVISKTQYPVRSKKFQNGTIKFIADRPGVITVDFSDTGSSGDNPAKRYLNINGKNTEFYTQRDGTSDRKVSGEIAVPAGEVSITGMDEDGTTPQPLQIFKVTYVPTGDPVSYEAYISYDLSRLEGWAFPRSVTTGTEIAVPYVVETYTGDLNNVVVSLMVNGKVADKQEVSKIAFDEDWGEGDYIGSFTYTAAEEGDLTIQLVLNFDGAALNEGENETEEVTIIVSDTPVIPEIENIAALKAYDAQGKEDVVLTLTNAKVTYVGATSSFVWEIMDYADVDFVVFEDATGGMMWQGSGLGSLVSEGQVLNGKLALSIESVLGDIYATLTNGLDGVEVTDGTVVPLVINDDNIFEWLGNPDWRLVELTNVTFKVVEDEWSREIHLVNDQIEEVGLTDVIGAFDVETLADAVSADAVTGYVYSLYGGFVTAFQPLSITNITTGISSAKATFSAEAPVYNLNGVRVSNPQKGLYIQNGKKVVLK